MATNVSESRHLDPADLATAVVKEVNDRAKYTTMRAEVRKDGAMGDAVLNITLLSETALPVPTRSQSSSAQAERWTFQFTVSSTLTKTDGVVVWSEASRSYPTFQSTQTNPEIVWNDPKWRRSFISTISNDLVIRMFYAR
jgi:hypothetical protein